VVLLGGNDTVSMEGISNNSSLGTVIRASDGNDTITITSAEFSAGNIAIYGGAGNDTITISGGNAAILNTNEDNDLVIATGGTTISAATFSTGADILRMSGTIDQLGMGNGHDTVSGSVVTVLTGGYHPR
jgi:Ca2+-binding RTX toxin-like protein